MITKKPQNLIMGLAFNLRPSTHFSFPDQRPGEVVQVGGGNVGGPRCPLPPRQHGTDPSGQRGARTYADQILLDGIVKGKETDTKKPRNSPSQGRCQVNTITVQTGSLVQQIEKSPPQCPDDLKLFSFI